MRVLHINTYDTGGAAIAAIRIHKALLKEGVDSKILFTKINRTDIPESFAYPKRKISFIRRQYLKLAVRLGSSASIWDANQAKLKGKIEGFESFTFPTSDYDITSLEIYQQADIIHLHWISDFIDYSFFSKNCKPIVWTLHDMNPFTGGCHNSMHCNEYRNSCSICPQLKGVKNESYSNLNLFYKKQFIANSNLSIVCLSDWMYENSMQSTLFKNFPHSRIDHCIDQTIFKPLNKEYCREILNLPKDKFILLTLIDRFNKGKGSDLLFETINNLNQEILFCTVGKNPKNDKIIYLGSIADERLIAVLYSAVDAIVIPSREENSPNTIIEALSCGTPVIAFPIGGIPDHVQTGITGILAESISSKSLKKAILEFVSGHIEFSKSEIRKIALAKFDMKEQVKKYVDIYQQKL